MKSAIVLLERRSLIPKQEWRSPSCSRTFAAIEVSKTITNARETHRSEARENAALLIPLRSDGSPQSPPSICPLEGAKKAFLGVFEVSFILQDQVDVTLREEECSRLLGSPRRSTRQIALMTPWNSMRVLLNGRLSGHSSQYYLLVEYHLMVCTEAIPERIAPPRFIDLQADLL